MITFCTVIRMTVVQSFGMSGGGHGKKYRKEIETKAMDEAKSYIVISQYVIQSRV